MSQTVDSRVVEMRFDNAQFEQNVRESMSTLDRLKASLNMDGASKSFDQLSKASNSVSFAGLYKNIEQLSKRFSTFGIVGMRVIQNLTDSAMKFVHNTMGTVTNSIVGGGKRRAMNIENARFQLQGLLNDEVKVEAIMKDALDSVDGTAYAFDEAAKAASQFAATGMQAGEDMYGALRGITGVAAMTNSEYENISRIFTTVAGNGRVMGDQLLQLSSRGLNAAVTIKDYFNGVNNGSIEANDSIKEYIHTLTKGLQVTEGDIREFVSSGKVSFDVFAKAMDNAFGEHAKKANDTLTGSISNVRAALARIGAEFISPLIVQKGPLVMFFNALRERVNDIKKNITPLANMFTDTVSSIATSATKYLKGLSFTGFFKEFNESVEKLHGFLNTQLFDRFGEFTRLITNAGLKLEDFQKAAFDVMADREIAKAEERNRTVKAELKSYDAFLAKYGSFQASLKTGWMTPQIFSNAIKKLTGDLKPMSEAFKTAEDVVKRFDEISNQVIRGNFGNGAERVKKLTEAGYDYATVQSVVNHKLLGWEIDLSKVTDTQLKNIGYTKKQIEAFNKLREEAEKSGSSMEELIKSFSQPTGAELFIGTIQNVIKGAVRVVKTFKDAWRETFTNMPVLPLYAFLSMLNKFSEKLLLSDENLENLKNTFKGALSIFDLGRSVLSGLYDMLAGIAKSIDPSFNGFGGYILKFTGFIGTTLTKIVEFVKANDIISKVFDPLTERLRFVVEKIRDVYRDISSSEKFQFGVGTILEDVKGFASNIGEWIGNALKIFEDFFISIKDLNGQFTLENVKKTIKDFTDDVFGYFTDLGAHFSGTGNVIFGFVKDLIQKFTSFDIKLEGVGENAENIITTIGNALKKFNFGGLIAMLGGAATIKFIMNVYNLLTAPKANIVKSFCGVLDSLKGTIDEFRKTIKYENMLKLAIAIAIFAGSIMLLARIETGKLYATVGAIILLAGALTVMNWLAGNIIKIGSKEGQVKKGTSGLLAIAAAIGVIAVSLKVIESLKDPKKSLGIAGIILAALLGVSIALQAMSAQIAGNAVGAAAVIGFAVSLFIIVQTLKQLETLNTDKLGPKLEVIRNLFLMVGALMIASKFVGKNAAKAGGMILMIAIALKLLVSTILILSLMREGTLDKGLRAISKIMLLFMGIMLVSKFAGSNAHKAGVMFLAMSVSIWILIGAIKLISLVSDEEITRAIYVLKQITLCFSVLMVASKFAGGEFKSIIALTVAIAALTIAIGALSFIPIDRLAAATVALSVVMGMMALMIYTTGSMGSAKRVIPNLIALVGVVAALALIIKTMSTMTDPTGAIKIAGSLSILLLSLTLAMRVVSNTKLFKQDTLANLMALTIIVGLLGLIIGLMAQNITNVDSLIPIAVSLSTLLLAMSGALLILSTVGAAGNAALGGIGALLALMGSIVLFVTAIGAINDLMGEKDLTYFADKAIPTLQKIGEAIGSFIGGIVGAFLDVSGLGDIGEGLKDFIQQIADFCTTTDGINPDVADIIPKITGAILAFAAAEFLDGVSSIISKLTGTKTLGTKLLEMAQGLKDFADAVSDGSFSDQTVKDAATLAEILSTMNSKLPPSGGLAQTILGEKDLSKFGKQLGDLASGLNAFVTNLGSASYSSDTIDQANTLAETLSTLASGLPSSGGVLQEWFFGTKDLASFGTQLATLATGLKNFVWNLGDQTYSSDTIDQAIKMGELLTVFAEKVPTSGGLLDKIFGGDDLGSFGTSLESLGNGLNKFASSMTDVDPSSADRAQTILAALLDVSDLQPGTLYKVATEVGQFSLSIETFGNKISAVDADKSDAIVRAITSLVKGAQDVGGVDTSKIAEVMNAISSLGNIDLGDVGPKIEAAASSMSTMASKMIQAFNTGISNAGSVVGKNAQIIANGFVSAVTAKIPVASAAGTKLGTALGDGIKSTAQSMPIQVGLALTATVAKVGSYYKNFNTAGSNLAKALASGLGSVGLSSAITGKLSSAVSNAREYHGSFYRAGAYLAEGLRDGIRDKASAVASAAASMVSSALTAARRAANEHSPSKETYEIGDYFGQGFINAIVDHFRNARKAGAGMVEQALKGTERPVKMINDIIQNGIDAQPTITPVLDLSQIKAGTGQINGILGATPALAMAGNISYAFNRNRTTATNDDVVHAINKLNKAIAEMPRESTTINGVTYDDGSNINDAVRQLVRAARIERRA